jgi:hypothetical protein
VRHRVAPLALALVLAGTGAVASAVGASGGAPSALGVYRGAAAPAEVAGFGVWLGRAPSVALDFLDFSSWSRIEDPSWWASAWSKSPYRVVYSVPLIPATGGTMQAGAGGAYNAHFRLLAESLVRQGQGDAVLRLGWEFNGDWMRWSASGDPDAFAGYWRQVVQTMRAVPGTSFKFDWCPNISHFSGVEASYPGDGYVDYIGMDAYDTWWTEADRTNVVHRWRTMLEQPGGLLWHRDFARAHGKPMTYPEWGLWSRPDGHGGGDNPYYIEKMYEWISQNDVAYHIYFEEDVLDGQHRLMTGRFQAGAAKYRSLFVSGPSAPLPTGSAGVTPGSGGVIVRASSTRPYRKNRRLQAAADPNGPTAQSRGWRHLVHLKQR